MPNLGVGELVICGVAFAMLLLGIVAIIAVVVMSKRGNGQLVKCPLCTAAISREAIVCPNCKRDLPGR